MLPVRPGLAERRTHDYVRHGTTTLFAALDVATGSITADACYDRHRNDEFLRFLKQVAKAHPRVKLHVVADNYATHSGVSYNRVPYKPYAPFPLKAWLWGAVAGELACPPTNPAGTEQVASVVVMRPQEAADVLKNEGRGYTQALQYWLSLGAPLES